MAYLTRALRYFILRCDTVSVGCITLVVGTILNLINQGDAIFGGMAINWTKIVLTYIAPSRKDMDLQPITVCASILAPSQGR